MIVSLPSRAELISWVNKIANVTCFLIQTGIQKLEQMSDGILFCTIFERIYPRTINLNKLKRDIRSPLEKEKNFRFLLNAINQMGIRVTINVSNFTILDRRSLKRQNHFHPLTATMDTSLV